LSDHAWWLPTYPGDLTKQSKRSNVDLMDISPSRSSTLGDWTFWQYTGLGHCDGIANLVDLNVARSEKIAQLTAKKA
jgi:GH25 family lysozyme M1 (1,4-beta-N-acetylmuramidase)